MNNFENSRLLLTPFCRSIHHIFLHTEIRGRGEGIAYDLLDSIDLAQYVLIAASVLPRFLLVERASQKAGVLVCLCISRRLAWSSSIIRKPTAVVWRLLTSCSFLPVVLPWRGQSKTFVSGETRAWLRNMRLTTRRIRSRFAWSSLICLQKATSQSTSQWIQNLTSFVAWVGITFKIVSPYWRSWFANTSIACLGVLRTTKTFLCWGSRFLSNWVVWGELVVRHRTLLPNASIHKPIVYLDHV